MWNLKYDQMNLSVKQKQNHIVNTFVVAMGMREGEDGSGVWA